jgi:tetratricopeptide (TPR) repeat protein
LQSQPQLQIREIDRAETFFYNLDPVANPLALRRGEAYLALNQMDKAFEDFLKAYRVHPNNILVLWNIAAMYERKKDLDKSEEYFQKALAISPRLEGALVNLTAVYIKMGNYEAAYEVIQRCHPESRNPKVAQYRRLIEQKLQVQQ